MGNGDPPDDLDGLNFRQLERGLQLLGDVFFASGQPQPANRSIQAAVAGKRSPRTILVWNREVSGREVGFVDRLTAEDYEDQNALHGSQR